MIVHLRRRRHRHGASSVRRSSRRRRPLRSRRCLAFMAHEGRGRRRDHREDRHADRGHRAPSWTPAPRRVRGRSSRRPRARRRRTPAMATLRDIRRRIRPSRTRKKITSAMKLVAAAKLAAGAGARILARRPYRQRLWAMLGDLAGAAERRSTTRSSRARAGAQGAALLVITSDRGPVRRVQRATLLRAPRAELREPAAPRTSRARTCIGRRPQGPGVLPPAPDPRRRPTGPGRQPQSRMAQAGTHRAT